MTAFGIILLVVGLIVAVFKGYVVWDIAHNSYNGGGAPTLDFPIFYPIPLALGTSLVFKAHGGSPFPGFGFAIYAGLAVAFGFLLWLFDRLGKPERERQQQSIQEKASLKNEPNA